MALTKAELAEALFDELGLNKREAKEFVDLFFEEIRGRLEEGKEVKLSGFGNFELRNKTSVQDAIPRPAKRFRSRRAASSRFVQGRSCA